MSAWRRHALRFFPTVQEPLNSREYTIYQLFFDLLPMVCDAHAANDREMLRKIYGFAQWCLCQKSEDLWNSAGVAFYEHLFDKPELWRHVVPWLSPQVILQCRPLWEARLQPSQLEDVVRIIDSRREHAYRECMDPAVFA
jgi:hypothetical protein